MNRTETLDYLMEGFQVVSYDWRYLFVNRAAVMQSQQTSKEDLLGYTMMEKFPGIENTELFRVLEQCMAQRLSARLDNEFVYPDRTKRFFDLRVQAVPEGICILSIDITDQKNAERKNREYIKGLENMMHMTSHKVRQPIGHILGACNVLDLPRTSGRDVQLMIEFVKESALALDSFTKDLTKFLHDMGPNAKKA